MRSRLALFSFLLLALTAHGDFVIEEKIESAASHERIVFRVKGKNVRAEISSAEGESSTVIIHTETGKANVLNEREKSSLAVDMNAVREEKRKTLWDAGIDLTLVSPQPTGKTEKIDGRDVEIYEYQVASQLTRIWAATDYPHGKPAQEALSLATNALDATSDPSLLRVPGFPLQWQQSSAGQKSTTTVISVTEQDLPDSIFAIPPDYVIITNPQ